MFVCSKESGSHIIYSVVVGSSSSRSSSSHSITAADVIHFQPKWRMRNGGRLQRDGYQLERLTSWLAGGSYFAKPGNFFLG